ncbi:MAG: hypothetical protein ABIH23_02350 [bacterium]
MTSLASLPVSDLRLSREQVLRQLTGLRVLDANVGVGSRSVAFAGDLRHADEILKDMDRCGISQAIAFHYTAIENNPLVGNDLLMKEIADRERLLPQWVLLPQSTSEFPPPHELASLLAERQVRCVRMAPKSHGYVFSSWCCGSVLEMLEEKRILLFMSVEEVDWDNLARVLSEFRQLQVVLTDTGYRIGRKVYPLLCKHCNLHMEYSDYVIHWGLEDLCNQIGPERFVFGSGLGRHEPGVPLTVLALADLPNESKRLLAAGNLARLLGLEEV